MNERIVDRTDPDPGVVPEPGSLSLAVLGLFGMLRLWNRRRAAGAAVLASAALALGLSFSAGATVITGASSAYGESVAVQGATASAVASYSSGPLPVASGNASPPYAQTSSALSAALPAFILIESLTVNAASDVDGAPGARFAESDAMVVNLLAFLGLTATTVHSTARVSGDFGALSAFGTTTLTNFAIPSLGITVPTDNPAPNTVIYESAPVGSQGITITLNQQTEVCGIATCSLSVNAIDIFLHSFPVPDAFLITAIGHIYIGHAEASLTAVAGPAAPVPESGTLALLASGLIGWRVLKWLKGEVASG
jgi:hypothetical protein